MKIKYQIVALCTLLASLSAQAENVRDFFITEPGNVFELLTQGVRAAMVTMAEQGKKIESENLHGGTAKIDSLSTTYMSVRCSDVKQVELKLLIKGKTDTVIAVVETVQLPAPDSRISFYTTKWKPIPAGKCIKNGTPVMTDFIKNGTPSSVVADVMSHISFPIIKLTFGTTDGALVASQQMEKFLYRDEYAKIRPYLTDSITYRIDGTKLKRLK